VRRNPQNSRAIGEAIRALDVPIGPVLASPLCRTVETAVLAFGFAEKSMATRDGGPEPVGEAAIVRRELGRPSSLVGPSYPRN
jgi:hypothetical protein